MSESRKGIHWFFRVYKLFTLGEDYPWQTQKIKLEKDYQFCDKNKNGKLRMTITKEGLITIRERYTWDGCTPKFSLLDLLVIGTPDGIISDKTGKPKAYHASMVHDALYQFLADFPPNEKLYTRRQADEVFLEILEDAEFAPRKLYYAAVRVFGGLFMGARKHITRRTDTFTRAIKTGKPVKKKRAASKS